MGCGRISLVHVRRPRPPHHRRINTFATTCRPRPTTTTTCHYLWAAAGPLLGRPGHWTWSALWASNVSHTYLGAGLYIHHLVGLENSGYPAHAPSPNPGRMGQWLDPSCNARQPSTQDLRQRQDRSRDNRHLDADKTPGAMGRPHTQGPLNPGRYRTNNMPNRPGAACCVTLGALCASAGTVRRMHRLSTSVIIGTSGCRLVVPVLSVLISSIDVSTTNMHNSTFF